MKTTAPKEINDTVTDFCKSVKPGSVPLFVDVEPVAGSAKGDCYSNVDKKIAASGGSKLHGWAIWQWPGQMIEAEHHTVWRAPDGVLKCVSPQRENRIVFLPDPDAVYNNVPISNKRRSLSPDPRMDQYIALMEQADVERIKGAKPDGSQVFTPEMMELTGRACQLQLEMGYEPEADDMEDALEGMFLEGPDGKQVSMKEFMALATNGGSRTLNPKEKAELRKAKRKQGKRKGK